MLNTRKSYEATFNEMHKYYKNMKMSLIDNKKACGAVQILWKLRCFSKKLAGFDRLRAQVARVEIELSWQSL